MCWERQSIYLKKGFAFLLALCLVLEVNPSFAASPTPLNSAVLTLNQPFDFQKLTVPSQIGSIKEKFLGNKPTTVFLIQDAHSIPSAQQNIGALIQYFQNEYDVDVTLLEGVSTNLDPQIFKSFPDPKLLKKVLNKYAERGELAAGAEAAIFSTQSRAQFEGIEDWNLYQEGIRLFLDAAKNERTIREDLKSKREKLKENKRKVYSKELLEVDQLLGEFQENQMGFVSILKKLTKFKVPEKESELGVIYSAISNAHKEDTSLEQEVNRMAQEISKRLRRKQTADNQHPIVILSPSRVILNEVKDLALRVNSVKNLANARSFGLLLGHHPQDDLKKFNQNLQAFQTLRMSPESFALFLKDLAKKYEIPVHASKRLKTLTSYEKRIQDIQGTNLFSEFERYTESIKTSLFRSDEERAIDREDHELRLFERLSHIELNRKDWGEIKEILSLRANIPRSGEAILDPGLLRPGHAAASPRNDVSEFQAHIAFYHNAEKREQIFVQKIDSFIKNKNPKSLIMVAGGFHTDGISKKLKDKGISFVSVAPKMNQIPEKINYQDQMQGKVSWNNYFKVKNGKVNLYDAFVQSVRDQLTAEAGSKYALETGSESAPALKFWRDQIIRDLAIQGRIEEASEYTRFIDEAGTYRNTPLRQLDLITEWQSNIHRFVDGLRHLKNENQITEANLLKLLKPSLIPAAATSPASLTHSELRADLLPNVATNHRVQNKILTSHSEMRSNRSRTSEVVIETIARAPEMHTVSDFIPWHEKQTPETLPRHGAPNQKLGGSRAALLLNRDRKIRGSLRNFQTNAGARNYAKTNSQIQNAPEIGMFDDFAEWYEPQTSETLPNRDKPGQKIGPSYAMLALSFAKKLEGDLEYFLRNAAAYEYALTSETIQRAPDLYTFRDFIRWYRRQTSRTLPRKDKPNQKMSASTAVLVLKHAKKIKGSVRSIETDAGAYDYAKESSVIQGAPNMRSFKKFIKWFEAETAETLPNKDTYHKKDGNKKISASYALQALGHAKKIKTGLQDLQRNASAYDYAKESETIKNAPDIYRFSEFIEWFSGETPETLPNRENPKQKISAGYAALILSHAKKIKGSLADIQLDAGAYDYANSTPAIQAAPDIETLEEFIKWFKAETSETLPNQEKLRRNKVKEKIGMSYAIRALRHAKKIKGNARMLQTEASAYEYGNETAAIQSAPDIYTFEEFIAWFENETKNSLPHRNKPNQKIGPSYALLALKHAKKIKGTLGTMTMKVGAYQRARTEKTVIAREIKKIWSRRARRNYRSALRRLRSEFNPKRLPNLKTGGLLTQSYRNTILKFAYELYGEALIRELQSKSPGRANTDSNENGIASAPKSRAEVREFDTRGFRNAMTYLEAIIKNREAVRDSSIKEISKEIKADLGSHLEFRELPEHLHLLDRLTYEIKAPELTIQDEIRTSAVNFLQTAIPDSREIYYIYYSIKNMLDRNPAARVDLAQIKRTSMVESFLDFYIFHNLFNLQVYLSRTHPPNSHPELAQGIQNLKKAYRARPKGWHFTPISQSSAYDSLVDYDEHGLLSRQFERVNLDGVSNPSERQKRIDLAASMAARVARHVRTIQYRREGNLVKYENTIDRAVRNGVDYALLMAYLIPLLESYRNVQQNTDQGNKISSQKNKLVLAIYSALSADPVILLDFNKMTELSDDSHLSKRFSSAIQNAFPTTRQDLFKRYQNLIQELADHLHEDFQALPSIQESLSHPSHLGSGAISGYALTAAAVFHGFKYPEDMKQNWYKKYHSIPDLESERKAYWEWAERFSQTIAKITDESIEIQLLRAKKAYEDTIKNLNPFRSRGETRAKDERSETRSGQSSAHHLLNQILSTQVFSSEERTAFAGKKEELGWLSLTDSIQVEFKDRSEVLGDFLLKPLVLNQPFILPKDITLKEFIQFRNLLRTLEDSPKETLIPKQIQRLKALSVFLSQDEASKDLGRALDSVWMSLKDTQTDSSQIISKEERDWIESLKDLSQEGITREIIQTIQMDVESLTYERGFKQKAQALMKQFQLSPHVILRSSDPDEATKDLGSPDPSSSLGKLSQDDKGSERLPDLKSTDETYIEAIEYVLKHMQTLPGWIKGKEFRSTLEASPSSEELNCSGRCAATAHILNTLGIKELFSVKVQLFQGSPESGEHVLLIARLPSGAYYWVEPSWNLLTAPFLIPKEFDPLTGFIRNFPDDPFYRRVEIGPLFERILSSFYNNLGNTYSKQGKLDLAVESFRKTLALDPDDAAALNNLGIAYLDQGKLDLAVEHYQKALALNPDLVVAHYNLGLAYLKLNRFADAAREFQEVLNRDPNDWAAGRLFDEAEAQIRPEVRQEARKSRKAEDRGQGSDNARAEARAPSYNLTHAAEIDLTFDQVLEKFKVPPDLDPRLWPVDEEEQKIFARSEQMTLRELGAEFRELVSKEIMTDWGLLFHRFPDDFDLLVGFKALLNSSTGTGFLEHHLMSPRVTLESMRIDPADFKSQFGITEADIYRYKNLMRQMAKQWEEIIPRKPLSKTDRLILAAEITEHGGPLGFGVYLFRFNTILTNVLSTIWPSTLPILSRFSSLRYWYWKIVERASAIKKKAGAVTEADEILSAETEYRKWLEGLKPELEALINILDHTDFNLIEHVESRELTQIIKPMAERMKQDAHALTEFLSDNPKSSAQRILLDEWLREQIWESKVKGYPLATFSAKVPIVAGRISPILVNPKLLHLALERLISNGFHVSMQRSANGKIDPSDLRIRVESVPDQPKIKMVILNPGRISDDKLKLDKRTGLPNLFSFQYSRPDLTSGGIGLPFAAMAIHQMGGTIDAKNRAEHGVETVEFTIEFPAYNTPRPENRFTQTKLRSQQKTKVTLAENGGGGLQRRRVDLPERSEARNSGDSGPNPAPLGEAPFSNLRRKLIESGSSEARAQAAERRGNQAPDQSKRQFLTPLFKLFSRWKKSGWADSRASKLPFLIGRKNFRNLSAAAFAGLLAFFIFPRGLFAEEAAQGQFFLFFGSRLEESAFVFQETEPSGHEERLELRAGNGTHDQALQKLREKELGRLEAEFLKSPYQQNKNIREQTAAFERFLRGFANDEAGVSFEKRNLSLKGLNLLHLNRLRRNIRDGFNRRRFTRQETALMLSALAGLLFQFHGPLATFKKNNHQDVTQIIWSPKGKVLAPHALGSTAAFFILGMGVMGMSKAPSSPALLTALLTGSITLSAAVHLSLQLIFHIRDSEVKTLMRAYQMVLLLKIHNTLRLNVSSSQFLDAFQNLPAKQKIVTSRNPSLQNLAKLAVQKTFDAVNSESINQLVNNGRKTEDGRQKTDDTRAEVRMEKKSETRSGQSPAHHLLNQILSTQVFSSEELTAFAGKKEELGWLSLTDSIQVEFKDRSEVLGDFLLKPLVLNQPFILPKDITLKEFIQFRNLLRTLEDSPKETLIPKQIQRLKALAVFLSQNEASKDLGRALDSVWMSLKDTQSLSFPHAFPPPPKDGSAVLLAESGNPETLDYPVKPGNDKEEESSWIKSLKDTSLTGVTKEIIQTIQMDVESLTYERGFKQKAQALMKQFQLSPHVILRSSDPDEATKDLGSPDPSSSLGKLSQDDKGSERLPDLKSTDETYIEAIESVLKQMRTLPGPIEGKEFQDILEASPTSEALNCAGRCAATARILNAIGIKELFSGTVQLFQGSPEAGKHVLLIARLPSGAYYWVEPSARLLVDPFLIPKEFDLLTGFIRDFPDDPRYRRVEIGPLFEGILSDFYNHLGSAYSKQGKLDSAVEYYQKALSLNPDLVEAHYNLGNAYAKQGKLDLAVESYQKALALNPNDADTHYNLGTAHSKQGKLDLAVERYKKALSLNPDDAKAHNNLGVAYFTQGKLDLAVESYKKALSLNPDYVDAHYNLGSAYVKLGRFTDAAGEYRAVLKLDPTDADAQQILKMLLELMREQNSRNELREEKSGGHLLGERVSRAGSPPRSEARIDKPNTAATGSQNSPSQNIPQSEREWQALIRQFLKSGAAKRHENLSIDVEDLAKAIRTEQTKFPFTDAQDFSNRLEHILQSSDSLVTGIANEEVISWFCEGVFGFGLPSQIVKKFIKTYYQLLQDRYLNQKKLSVTELREMISQFLNSLQETPETITQKRKYFDAYLHSADQDFNYQKAFYITEALNREVLIPHGFILLFSQTIEGGYILAYGTIARQDILTLTHQDGGWSLEIPAFFVNLIELTKPDISGFFTPDRVLVFSNYFENHLTTYANWIKTIQQIEAVFSPEQIVQLISRLESKLERAQALAFYKHIYQNLKDQKSAEDFQSSIYDHEALHYLTMFMGTGLLSSLEAVEQSNVQALDLAEHPDHPKALEVWEPLAARLLNQKTSELLKQFHLVNDAGQKARTVAAAYEILVDSAALAQSNSPVDFILSNLTLAFPENSGSRDESSYKKSAGFLISFFRDKMLILPEFKGQNIGLEDAYVYILEHPDLAKEWAKELIHREFYPFVNITISRREGTIPQARIVKRDELRANQHSNLALARDPNQQFDAPHQNIDQNTLAIRRLETEQYFMNRKLKMFFMLQRFRPILDIKMVFDENESTKSADEGKFKVALSSALKPGESLVTDFSDAAWHSVMKNPQEWLPHESIEIFNKSMSAIDEPLAERALSKLLIPQSETEDPFGWHVGAGVYVIPRDIFLSADDAAELVAGDQGRFELFMKNSLFKRRIQRLSPAAIVSIRRMLSTKGNIHINRSYPWGEREYILRAVRHELAEWFLLNLNYRTANKITAVGKKLLRVENLNYMIAHFIEKKGAREVIAQLVEPGERNLEQSVKDRDQWRRELEDLRHQIQGLDEILTFLDDTLIPLVNHAFANVEPKIQEIFIPSTSDSRGGYLEKREYVSREEVRTERNFFKNLSGLDYTFGVVFLGLLIGLRFVHPEKKEEVKGTPSEEQATQTSKKLFSLKRTTSSKYQLPLPSSSKSNWFSGNGKSWLDDWLNQMMPSSRKNQMNFNPKILNSGLTLVEDQLYPEGYDIWQQTPVRVQRYLGPKGETLKHLQIYNEFGGLREDRINITYGPNDREEFVTTYRNNGLKQQYQESTYKYDSWNQNTSHHIENYDENGQLWASEERNSKYGYDHQLQSDINETLYSPNGNILNNRQVMQNSNLSPQLLLGSIPTITGGSETSIFHDSQNQVLFTVESEESPRSLMYARHGNHIDPNSETISIPLGDDRTIEIGTETTKDPDTYELLRGLFNVTITNPDGNPIATKDDPQDIAISKLEKITHNGSKDKRTQEAIDEELRPLLDKLLGQQLKQTPIPRQEARTLAANIIVNALDPRDQATPLPRAELRQIYELTISDFEGFVETIEKITKERIESASNRLTRISNLSELAAVQSGRLLNWLKNRKWLEGEITLALQLGEAGKHDSFLKQLLDELGGQKQKAKLFTSRESHPHLAQLIGKEKLNSLVTSIPLKGHDFSTEINELFRNGEADVPLALLNDSKTLPKSMNQSYVGVALENHTQPLSPNMLFHNELLFVTILLLMSEILKSEEYQRAVEEKLNQLSAQNKTRPEKIRQIKVDYLKVALMGKLAGLGYSENLFSSGTLGFLALNSDAIAAALLAAKSHETFQKAA